MAFTIPTLQTVLDRVRGDLNTRMGNSNALIPRSLAWVTAHLVAGAVWGLYLYQSYIAKQVIPDTAESEYLERWARIFGIYRTAAVKADGTVTITGTAGSTLSTGAVIERADGEQFTVDAGDTWATSGNKDFHITAVTAGLSGNTLAGVKMSLVSPPSGVVAQVTVKAPGITGGSDEQTDASLLATLLSRIQNPPQGGSVADYNLWAAEAGAAAGFVVDKVWVESWQTDPGLAVGEIATCFTIVGDETDPVSMIPDVAQCNAVWNYIKTKAPVTAIPVYSAVLPQSVTLTLDATLATGYTKAQAADDLALELRDVFREQANVNHAGYTIHNSYLQEAVGRIPGILTFTLTSVDGGAGTDPVVVAAGGGGSCIYATIDAADINITEV